MDNPTNPNPQHDPYPHHHHPPAQPNPQPRRPRGFAATSSSSADPNSNPSATTKLTSTKREREKEKERTKLRERHRRAITSRMLAGLRQYGNFPLPARADMNDVLAALAREAGWTVEPDGTTYRQSPHSIAPLPSTIPHHSSQMGATSFGVSMPGSSNLKSSTTMPKDCGLPSSSTTSASFLRVDENLSPAASLCGDSLVIDAASQRNDGNFVGGSSPININPVVECLDADQFIHNVHSVEQGNGFIGTPYIPVYVTLATGFINNFCQLVNPQGVREELSHLASLVDGVLVDCWWGIVEAWSPQNYVWSGYRELFDIIREFKLKLQVVMAFHEHGGNDVGGAFISLPQWVLEIGKEDQDIYFTDREGRRNIECLSWSIDKQRVLKGRTGIEVYSDFMRSFRTEFDDLFADGLISAVEIGLGPSGELRYPSFSERMGWSFPGIGEFQCYDKYFQHSLHKSAKMRGHVFWGKVPDNAGDYCSRPNETGFFCDRGDYDSYYGRFFLQWYARALVDHAENVLSLASLAFEDTNIVVKIPAIHWWYKTASHAAELMAGYYNSSNRDGYSSVFEALKKYSVTVKFVCSGLPVTGHDIDAFSDPEGLRWQVLNAAWERGLSVAGVNELSCYDRERCLRVIEMLKPRNDPDHHSFSFFVYQQPSLLVQGYSCFPDFCHFIKCMHGEVSDDLLS